MHKALALHKQGASAYSCNPSAWEDRKFKVNSSCSESLSQTEMTASLLQ